MSRGGKVVRIPVDTVSLVGRRTQGVRLVRLEKGDRVSAVARVLADEGPEEQ